MLTDHRIGDHLVEDGPTPLPPAAFSHALTLHPLANPEDRRHLFNELARLLAPNGQALVAVASTRQLSRRSIDLVREYAVKLDDNGTAASAAETAALVRPTEEMIERRARSALRFEFPVDVSSASSLALTVPERARLLRGPHRPSPHPAGAAPHTDLGLPRPGSRAFAYVRDAIDKYWSDGTFELTVNVACASGRESVTVAPASSAVAGSVLAHAGPVPRRR